jgi:hypothetical protein
MQILLTFVIAGKKVRRGTVYTSKKDLPEVNGQWAT